MSKLNIKKLISAVKQLDFYKSSSYRLTGCTSLKTTEIFNPSKILRIGANFSSFTTRETCQYIGDLIPKIEEMNNFTKPLNLIYEVDGYQTGDFSEDSSEGELIVSVVSKKVKTLYDIIKSVTNWELNYIKSFLVIESPETKKINKVSVEFTQTVNNNTTKEEKECFSLEIENNLRKLLKRQFKTIKLEDKSFYKDYWLLTLSE